MSYGLGAGLMPDLPPGVSSQIPDDNATAPPPGGGINMASMYARMRSNLGPLSPSVSPGAAAVQRLLTPPPTSTVVPETNFLKFLLSPTGLLLIGAVAVGGYFLFRKKGKK